MPSTTLRSPKAAPRKARPSCNVAFVAPDQTLARIDGKCRLSLGTVAAPGEQFTIRREPSGDIVLRPVKIVPANEAWLWENKEALASVLRGMREAEEGKTVSLDEFMRGGE